MIVITYNYPTYQMNLPLFQIMFNNVCVIIEKYMGAFYVARCDEYILSMLLTNRIQCSSLSF